MSRSAIAALRAFAQAPGVESCDFCGAGLAEPHAHVVDAQTGAPRCACPACALLFPDHGGRFRRADIAARRLAEPVCSDAQWTALGIPVGLAWFCREGRDARLRAWYPGAGGAVAARSDDDAWQALGDALPVLRALAPATEALLVRRRAGTTDCWLVPVERCWHLAGLLRRHWRGFDGGAEMRGRLDAFFAGLDA